MEPIQSQSVRRQLEEQVRELSREVADMEREVKDGLSTRFRAGVEGLEERTEAAEEGAKTAEAGATSEERITHFLEFGASLFELCYLVAKPDALRIRFAVDLGAGKELLLLLTDVEQDLNGRDGGRNEGDGQLLDELRELITLTGRGHLELDERLHLVLNARKADFRVVGAIHGSSSLVGGASAVTGAGSSTPDPTEGEPPCLADLADDLARVVEGLRGLAGEQAWEADRRREGGE